MELGKRNILETLTMETKFGFCGWGEGGRGGGWLVHGGRGNEDRYTGTGERGERRGWGVCDKSTIHSQLFATRTRSSSCVTFHHQMVKKV